MSQAIEKDKDGVYVGPRPFRTGQKLYGRESESRQLVSLLISRRLVLLHSPSGAGKTSLIHAKIVPSLAKRRFEIPSHQNDASNVAQPAVVRVNRGRESGDPPGANRYLLSTLLSLELHRPEKERRSAGELASLTIGQYLDEEFPRASLETGEGDGFRPLLLLFDQFEELLTLDPTDRKAKQDFLRQLGAALENEGRWALFSIREDFLGALEPFLTMIPTGLSATYHLDPLPADLASEAIVAPAAEAGVTYEEGVVESLIEDLRLVRVQTTDGKFEMKAGPSVEPVHLQVVCRSLWQVKGEARVIRREHLEELGRGKGTGVDEVLGGYYADCVRRAADEDGVTERLVRSWFGTQLIGAQKVRRPILVDEAARFGMSPKSLEVLDKAFLIRRETRSGAQWYELAHDRLMDPVLADNEGWRAENLSQFQIQAELWEERNRPESLLLSGASLAEAEKSAEENPNALTEAETAFVEESVRTRKKVLAEQEREHHIKRLRTMRAALVIGSTVLIALAGLAFWALRQRDIADDAKRVANWGDYAGLIAQAQSYWEQGYRRLAWEYLVEASSQAPEEGQQGWELVYLKTLFDRDKHTLYGHDASVTSVAFSLDGMRAASGSLDGDIRIWDLATRQPVLNFWPQGNHWITAIAYNPDGSRLVNGDSGGFAHVWDTKSDGDLLVSLEGHGGPVQGVAFSPDGKWIVTASDDKTVRIWDAETGKEILAPLEGHKERIKGLAMGPDGSWFASYSETDGAVKFWNRDGEKLLEWEPGDRVTGIATLPPDSLVYATESTIEQVTRAGVAEKIDLPKTKPGQQEEVLTAIAANSTGSWVATGTRRGMVNRHWVKYDNTTGLPNPFPERKPHNGAVTSLAIRPQSEPGFDRPWVIVSGGVDCLVKISDDAPAYETPTLNGHDETVWNVHFSPDGKRIVSSSWDGAMNIWSQAPARIDGKEKQIPGRVWEPCELHLAAGGIGEIPEEWTGKKNGAVFLARDEENLHIRIFDRSGLRLVDTGEPELTDEVAKDLAQLKTSLEGLWEGQPIDFQRRQQILDVLTATVGFWQARWKVERTFREHDGLVSSAWDPDGEWIASGDEDGKLRIWPVGRENAPRNFTGHQKWIFQIAVNNDGDRMATCGGDHDILLWDVDGSEDQKPVRLVGHEDVVNAVVFSPDGGDRLYSIGKDGTIRIWDTDAGEMLRKLDREHSKLPGDEQEKLSQPMTLALSPDGKTLACGFRDSTITLWDTTRHDEIGMLRGHTAWVVSLAFSPDGSRLASGSQDNTIKLWELKTGHNVLALTKHLDSVWCLGFSPAPGNYIVSGSGDHTIKIWEATSHDYEFGIGQNR